MPSEDAPKMHAGDEKLFTGPYVTLTPALLTELKQGIEAHAQRYKDDFPKLVADCPYETRLAVACWVMKHVYAHAKEGGTYRWLIYTRLGFGPDSYAPMMFADALNISNEFNVTETSPDDLKLGHVIEEAAADLPLGEARSRMFAAYFRFEELAAFARAASVIIERQRVELLARASPP